MAGHFGAIRRQTIKARCRQTSPFPGYLSRTPIANPEPIENYDEEYAIICVLPLLEFIYNYGSITEENTNSDTNGPIKRFSPDKQPIGHQT